MVSRDTVKINGYGEEVRSKGIPTPLLVFGWYINGGEEFGSDGHVNQVSYDASVLAKTGDLGVDDEVLLPGHGWFRVDGPPANYDNNPWWSPGIQQVQLVRVSGYGSD